MYTIETLTALNGGYCSQHILTQNDVDVINGEILRAMTFHQIHSTPQVGDIVEGAYNNGTHEYKNGIIERVDIDEATNKVSITICTHGSAYLNSVEPSRMSISVSGGIFITHDESELKMTSRIETCKMWHFGSAGACANGGIYFEIPVKRWQIPYEWNARHSLIDCIDLRDNQRNIYISLDSMFRLRDFSDIGEAKRFLDHVGVSYELFDSREGYAYYKLSHNFTEANGGFWNLDDVPKEATPIKLMSNGSFVDGFFLTTDREVLIYRPNPNSKEVYKPMHWKEACEYRRHNFHI